MTLLKQMNDRELLLLIIQMRKVLMVNFYNLKLG